VQGRHEDAIKKLQRAMNFFRNFYGEGDERVADMLNVVGAVYQSQGNYEKSEEAFLQVIDIFTALHGGESFKVGFVHNNVGAMCLTTGRLDEAQWRFENALRIARAADQYAPQYVASTLLNIAALQIRQNKLS
jgi:tetratricopeptide (TPR) repeat protein